MQLSEGRAHFVLLGFRPLVLQLIRLGDKLESSSLVGCSFSRSSVDDSSTPMVTGDEYDRDGSFRGLACQTAPA